MNFPPCPLPPNSNVLTYARVSPGPNQDISAQNDYLARYTAYYQLNVVRHFQDVALSGGSADRDALIELINFATSQEGIRLARGILFCNMDRLSRDVDDGPLLRAILRQHGYSLVFIDTPSMPGPEGRLLEAVHDYRAHKFREELIKRVKDKHKFLRQLRHPDTGRYLGVYQGRTPFGFVIEKINLTEIFPYIVKNNGQPRIVTRLVGPDPGLAPRIVHAYELCAAGWSYPDIERETDLFGWPLRAGRHTSDEDNYYYKRYGYLFRLPIYRGDYVYNEKVYLGEGQKAPDGQEVHTIRKANPLLGSGYLIKRYYVEPEIYEDFVEAIVPADLWQKVQAVRQSRPGRASRTGTARNHLLSGLCFCGHCQSPLYCMTRTCGGKYLYRRYECSEHIRSRACQFTGLRAEVLEQGIIGWLETFMDVEFFAELTDRVNQYFAGRSSESTINEYRLDIEDLARRRANLLALAEEGDRSAVERYRQLGGELQQAEAELARLQHELHHLRPIHVSRQEIQAAIDQIHTSIHSEDQQTKRSAIKRTIARIEAGKTDRGEYFAKITPNLDPILGSYDAIRRSQYHLDSLTFKIDLTKSCPAGALQAEYIPT